MFITVIVEPENVSWEVRLAQVGVPAPRWSKEES